MDISAIGLGGLEQARGRFEHAAARIARPADAAAPPAISDTVELVSARQEYEINLNVLKNGDRMERLALDLLA